MLGGKEVWRLRKSLSAPSMRYPRERNRLRSALTRPEEGEDAPQTGDEHLDFGFGVVDIKTRAGRASQAEFAHERLVAVMPSAESKTVFIRKRDDVVRVHVGKAKLTIPLRAPVGPSSRIPGIFAS